MKNKTFEWIVNTKVIDNFMLFYITYIMSFKTHKNNAYVICNVS